LNPKAGTSWVTEGLIAKQHTVGATVAVLSAGGRASLISVLNAALAARPAPFKVQLIWSGVDPIPPDVPAEVDRVVVEPKSFDHGGTRQLALELCDTEVLVLLTDDAVPATTSWLEALIRPLVNKRVVAVYGRQLARPSADFAEQVFRAVRYPDTSMILTREHLDSRANVLPVSDANAAYRVRALTALGGFPRRCKSGEDCVVAAKVLTGGWAVAYAADAPVWHSHSLTWFELIKRGWMAGVLASARGQERVVASIGGGIALVRLMMIAGWRRRRLSGVVTIIWVSWLRAVGYLAGRAFGSRLP